MSSITCSKKYTERTVYSITTYIFTKIRLPTEQWNLVSTIHRTRFPWKRIKKDNKASGKMDRNELLWDQIRENKDPKTILVSTWHPKLSAIPSNLKHNFHLISSNPKLSNIFKQKPTVTYRKNKSLWGHLLKNDIANQKALETARRRK